MAYPSERVSRRVVAALPCAQICEAPASVVALEAIQIDDEFSALIECEHTGEIAFGPERHGFVDERLRS